LRIFKRKFFFQAIKTVSSLPRVCDVLNENVCQTDKKQQQKIINYMGQTIGSPSSDFCRMSTTTPGDLGLLFKNF